MSEQTKENPLSAVILAEDADQGAGGIAALPTRVGRYAEAHRRALAMADYARDIGEKSIASKLTFCGDYLLFRHFYTVDDVRLHAAKFCRKHLLCPLCAIRRASKYMQAYMQRLELVLAEHPGLQAFLVTVTVKDGEDLQERFQHLRAAMRRMTQARRDHLKAPAKNRHVEAAKALGGVHSIEAKRGKGSGLWHPHAHAVWLCYEAPDAAKLAQEWHAWTGDSYIVDVRPFHDQHDVASGFAEVFKYALKFAELPLADNWLAFQELSNRRLVDSFGLLRGVEVPDELTDEPLEGLPYIDYLYRWMGKGYSLAHQSEPIAGACEGSDFGGGRGGGGAQNAAGAGAFLEDL